MKFQESPVGRRQEVWQEAGGRRQEAAPGLAPSLAPGLAPGMPLHLQSMLCSTQFQAYRSQGGVQGLQRTSSLEMLNNSEFEEKRALIASTLSLTDLLKPDQRGALGPGGPGNSHYQVGALQGGQGGFQGGQQGYQQNGYVVPQSLLKQHNQPHNPNANGYNVNFLNNGVPDKDLGKDGMDRARKLLVQQAFYSVQPDYCVQIQCATFT